MHYREFIEAARSTVIDATDTTAAELSGDLLALDGNLTGSRIERVLSESPHCDPDNPLGKGMILQVLARVDTALEGQLHALPYTLRCEIQLLLDFKSGKQLSLPFDGRKESTTKVASTDAVEVVEAA